MGYGLPIILSGGPMKPQHGTMCYSGSMRSSVKPPADTGMDKMSACPYLWPIEKIKKFSKMAEKNISDILQIHCLIFLMVRSVKFFMFLALSVHPCMMPSKILSILSFLDYFVPQNILDYGYFFIFHSSNGLCLMSQAPETCNKKIKYFGWLL